MCQILARPAFLTLLAAMIGCAQGDTMEDIWPDPDDRQGVLLRASQQAVQSYWADEGSLPSSLDELAAERPTHLVVQVDEWGNRLRHTRSDEGLCIWSSGADMRFETDDDLAMHGAIQDLDLVFAELRGIQISSRCLYGPLR